MEIAGGGRCRIRTDCLLLCCRCASGSTYRPYIGAAMAQTPLFSIPQMRRLQRDYWGEAGIEPAF